MSSAQSPDQADDAYHLFDGVWGQTLFINSTAMKVDGWEGEVEGAGEEGGGTPVSQPRPITKATEQLEQASPQSRVAPTSQPFSFNVLRHSQSTRHDVASTSRDFPTTASTNRGYSTISSTSRDWSTLASSHRDVSTRYNIASTSRELAISRELATRRVVSSTSRDDVTLPGRRHIPSTSSEISSTGSDVPSPIYAISSPIHAIASAISDMTSSPFSDVTSPIRHDVISPILHDMRSEGNSSRGAIESQEGRGRSGEGGRRGGGGGGGRGGGRGGGGRGGVQCAFCKCNGETKEFYTTHTLKDWRGMVICPVLRAFTCPRCGVTGDRAHTESHCPLATTDDQPLMAAVRTRRSSCGRLFPSHTSGTKRY